MRFGLLLGGQFLPGDRSPSRIDLVLEQVVLARQAGFHSVWAVHHLAAEFQYLQPIALLARLAAESGEMELGLGTLILPFFHPLIAAEELTTLDVITRGKLVAGFGLGYRDDEFRLLGIPKRERVARFEQALAFLRQVWSEEPGAASHPVTTRPVRRPPIWLGAMEDPGIRRAARLGDAWLIPAKATKARVQEKLRIYREALAEYGASAEREQPILRETFIRKGMSHRAAKQQALAFMATKYQAYQAWGQSIPAGTGMDDLAADCFILGDPAACIDEIRQYEQLGMNHLLFRVDWAGMPQQEVLRTLALLGEQVLPAFA